MIEAIIPKLPMRDKAVTKEYYQRLGFHEFGTASIDDYLMMEMEKFQIHFFSFQGT